jgi:hypothetical protein
VIFCNLNEEILKLFKILGFIEIFTIADSLSDAKGIFQILSLIIVIEKPLW